MLDLSYEQMLDQITQVRRGIVTIAASRKQIELHVTSAQITEKNITFSYSAKAAHGTLTTISSTSSGPFRCRGWPPGRRSR